jgi:hypothetical protein
MTATPGASESTIPWLTSLDEGLHRGQTEEKPVLVDFFSPT